jgi:hypothetical protein
MKDNFYKEVKAKVEAYSGDLKSVILKILDNRPDLAYIFDKYLK